MIAIKKKDDWKECLILFLIGLIILFFRSAYTIIVPSLYAEDGAWISYILNNGFIQAVFHVRPDYLVSGNIILLGIALLLNTIFCGENLNYLPHFTTLVHYIFFSLTALLPYVCFKGTIRKSLRLLTWLCILLVPLGNSGVEIFGKILNVGYLFFFIAFCLLYYRINNRESLSKIQIVLVDIILLISCATHPGCYVLVGLGFILDVFLQYKKIKQETFLQTLQVGLSKFYNKSWIILGCCCCILAAYDLFVLTGDAYEAINYEKVSITIEFFARGLLFYFIYPIYTHLNDTIVIGVFAIAILVLIMVYMVKPVERKLKIQLSIALFAWLFYFAITAVVRGEQLFPILSNYSTTYADRYYYGINILSLIPIMISIEILLQSKNKCIKIIGYLIPIYMLVAPISNINYIFQYDKEITGWTHTISFKDRLEQATYDATSQMYIVPIDPEGISISIPENYYFASIQNVRHAQPLVAAEFTDVNWASGIGVQEGLNNRILFTDNWYPLLKNCDTLTVGEKTVKVQTVETLGDWVHVVCNTTDLYDFAYPNEITFTLKGDTNE